MNEYRHVTGVRRVFPDSAGTRVIVIDDKGDGFVYNPVSMEHVIFSIISGFNLSAPGVCFITNFIIG